MQTLNNQNGIENSSSRQDCEFTYAGFLPRLFAYIIDIIVIGIASFFIKNIVLGGLGSVSLSVLRLYLNIHLQIYFHIC